MDKAVWKASEKLPQCNPFLYKQFPITRQGCGTGSHFCKRHCASPGRLYAGGRKKEIVILHVAGLWNSEKGKVSTEATALIWVLARHRCQARKCFTGLEVLIWPKWHASAHEADVQPLESALLPSLGPTALSWCPYSTHIALILQTQI